MFNRKNFKIIKNKNIEINTYIDGKGPLVIMAHGWPESWYSWRHQITSLVKNGFKVAVPDMRGYGKLQSQLKSMLTILWSSLQILLL